VAVQIWREYKYGGSLRTHKNACESKNLFFLGKLIIIITLHRGWAEAWAVRWDHQWEAAWAEAMVVGWGRVRKRFELRNYYILGRRLWWWAG
jgi:hypothetical protein